MHTKNYYRQFRDKLSTCVETFPIEGAAAADNSSLI